MEERAHGATKGDRGVSVSLFYLGLQGWWLRARGPGDMGECQQAALGRSTQLGDTDVSCCQMVLMHPGRAGTQMMSRTVLCMPGREEKLKDCSCPRTCHEAVHS